MKTTKLKTLRTVRGMSLEELETLSRIPLDALEKVENGKQATVNTKSLAKLSEMFGVEPSELLAVEEDKSSPRPASPELEVRLACLHELLEMAVSCDVTEYNDSIFHACFYISEGIQGLVDAPPCKE